MKRASAVPTPPDGSKRTQSANRHLADLLAFIAGAVNAGGLLAIGPYTSHMTGIVSAMADNLAVGSVSLVFSGLGAACGFLAGAFLTTMMVRWARAKALESEYALPLVFKSALLILFGLTGRVFETGHLVVGTVMLLCFTMGFAKRHHHQDLPCRHPHNTPYRNGHGCGYINGQDRICTALAGYSDTSFRIGKVATTFLTDSRCSLPAESSELLSSGTSGSSSPPPLAAILLVLAAMPGSGRCSAISPYTDVKPICRSPKGTLKAR